MLWYSLLTKQIKRNTMKENDLNVQVRLFQRGHFRVMPTPSYPLLFFIPITTYENGSTSSVLSFYES